MKPATLAEIKKELQQRSPEEISQLCLRLARFKKENKELLTYLLQESEDEASYVEGIKTEVEGMFDQINVKSYHYIKKSVRKILGTLKKYIRYSGNKETEVELLLHFCQQLRAFRPSIRGHSTLVNLYQRQLVHIEKQIGSLHEDLQYDYGQLLGELRTGS